MKDKWAAQTKALIEGVSTATAARRCGVHDTTAFRWRHRFLASLAGDKPKTLAGIVEGDETFILESFKGKRAGLPRKSRKVIAHAPDLVVATQPSARAVH
jgi:hypothetical protein